MSKAVIGANTINYLYNGIGQRVSKSGPSAIVTGGTNYYAYDEQGHLLGEYNGSAANILQETVYLGDLPVAVLVPNAQAGQPVVGKRPTTPP